MKTRAALIGTAFWLQVITATATSTQQAPAPQRAVLQPEVTITTASGADLDKVLAEQEELALQPPRERTADRRLTGARRARQENAPLRLKPELLRDVGVLERPCTYATTSSIAGGSFRSS